MKTLHLIEVTYIGPTNTRGARVKLYSHRFVEARFIPYDYAAVDGVVEMAARWLYRHDFNVLARAETKRGYAILTDTLEPLKGMGS